MSVAHAGVPKSEETRKRMSEAKLNDPDKSWKRRISETKIGRTNKYYQMRREYRALKAVSAVSFFYSLRRPPRARH